MLRSIATAAVLAAGATIAYADGHAIGDAAAGEKTFARCKSCHMIESADEVIVKGGKTGPNLYGIVGRQAGTADFNKYGDALVAAGEAGLIWTPELIAEYVVDPKAFLAKTLDDNSVRSRMAFKLRKGGEDIAAYLATFSAEDS
ncbi:MAG: cytochrome C [Pseudomonadota bacterium]